MNRQSHAAIAFAALVGCGGPPPPSPLATPPAGAASPPASAGSAATPAPPPPTDPPSAFTKVAMIGEDPTLYRLGKRVFIARRHGATFLEIKNGEIERAHAVSPGFDTCKDDSDMGMLEPGSLHGDFDKTAWLERLAHGARTTFITLERWDGTRWQHTKGPQYSGQLALLGAFPWRKSTLFLVTWYNHSSHFDVLEGPDKAPVAAPSNKEGGWPFTRMLARAAVKTHEGDLWLAGADAGAPALERFSEGSLGSTFEPVPLEAGEPGGELTHVVGRSSRDLYVVGQVAQDNHFVSHYDGKQWSRLPRLPGANISAIALAPDGSPWVVDRPGGDLDRKPSSVFHYRDGKWTKVPVSDAAGQPLTIDNLWVLDDGDVWLAAGGSLYRNRPARSVFTWSDPLCPAIATARPATEHCRESVFVLLYTLVKTTPKDYDFPLLRKAIKGHSELAKVTFAETDERGRRYFVAFMERDAYDRIPLGNKLVALVKKEVPSSTPALLCGSPRVVRELPIDVTTGEVVKKK